MTQWKRGDIARCINTADIKIDSSRMAGGGRYLVRGADYTVRGVVDDRTHGGLCLDVGAEWGPKLAVRFKKVPPNTRQEPKSRGVTPPTVDVPTRRDRENIG